MWLRPRVRPAGGDDCRKPRHSPAGVSVACDYRQAANKRQLLAPGGGRAGRAARQERCALGVLSLLRCVRRVLHPPPTTRGSQPLVPGLASLQSRRRMSVRLSLRVQGVLCRQTACSTLTHPT